MDKKRQNYLNSLMLDWARWMMDGSTSPGIFSTSTWPSGRPVDPRKSPKQHRPLVPVSNPKETRQTIPKIPCMRIAYREERVHRAIVLLPESFHPVICCLYLKGCDFYDTSMLLGITSKKVGRLRYKLLVSVDNVLKCT